ncbi:hypothetical protein N7541_005294 [Penicillium brevicompactum]|uniref:Uncharacterized protein n=1 Tax=Penicillium brevicompactum TaxID=5074 RepID=A0A9W9UX73_PENBR|nr:hypothetical protein N7541_005294 [Penicillium brevicompactum]
MAPAASNVLPTITARSFPDVTTGPTTTTAPATTVLVQRDTWPTNTFVTLTWPDSPPATVVDAAAATPTWSYSAETNSGLSNGAKGAIAGSIIGAAVLLLLLYCWCQRPPRSRSASRRRSQFIRVSPPSDPAADPEGSVKKEKKKKKFVTIVPGDPKDPDKTYRLQFPPLVKFTTDMNATTTIDIRESKRGSPLPYFIRPLERGK